MLHFRHMAALDAFSPLAARRRSVCHVQVFPLVRVTKVVFVYIECWANCRFTTLGCERWASETTLPFSGFAESRATSLCNTQISLASYFNHFKSHAHGSPAWSRSHICVVIGSCVVSSFSIPHQCLKADLTYLCPVSYSQSLWISWRRSSWTSHPMKWSTFAGWCAMCGKTWPTASPCGGRDAEEIDFGSPLFLKRPQTGGCFTSCALIEGIFSRTRQRKVRSVNSCSTHTWEALI